MFNRWRTSSDFRNEVDSHLQIEADRLHAQGLTEEEARAAARRAFGNVGQAEERFFEAHRWLWWDHLWQDIRLGARMFSRNAGFTAVAVLTLALGIAANTAIFSIVNKVLLRPLPFPNPEELVYLGIRVREEPGWWSGSPAKFAHYRTLSDAVRLTSAFQFGAVNLSGSDRPERLARAEVSADFFALFGAPLVQGRTFSADEDLPSGPRVVVLGGGLWTRKFAADPGAVGKTIILDGEPHTIIGVVASSFDTRDLGPIPDVYTPIRLDPNSVDQGEYFITAGRLVPGTSLAQADARVRATSESFRQRFPESLTEPGVALAAMSMQDTLVHGYRQMLLVLAGAVGLVLLLACANVANLLLIRATGRRREIVLRATLGARRGRIVRQLLTESLLLAALGGTLGLGLGVFGIRVLLTLNGVNWIPRLSHPTELGIDWRVLVFIASVVLTTGILFGILPALTASRPDLTVGLKEGGGRTGTAFRLSRVQAVLIVAEVALAVVLLTGAGLLMRTLRTLSGGERGFDGGNVQTMTMSLRGTPFQTSARVAQLTHDATERLAAIPDVEHVTAGCCLPIRGGYGFPLTIVGRPLTGPSHGNMATQVVGPRYFEVFRIPIVRGRGFTEQDVGAAPQVAIINEAMAKQLWPDGDPLKDRIMFGRVMKELETESERQIVGIVGNAGGWPYSKPWPLIYIPNAQFPDAMTALTAKLDYPLTWAIRTARTSAAINRDIQSALEEASGLPVDRVESMETAASSMISGPRFNTVLMTIFGTLALVLATIGIYGVMAYSVKQRTQEIGIRMALGARHVQVRRMVIGQGMWLAVTGLIIGLGLALGLTRVLSAKVFWAKSGDPLLFAAVVGALGAVALFSVWLPAVRASAVDPVEALRAD